jgi:hypothetical protein
MDEECGPAKEECYFLIKGKECTNKRIPLSNFCPEHKAFFVTLDNPTLIEQGARNLRKLMYVNDEKKISAMPDMEILGDFNNILSELSERGYTDDEAMEAFANIAVEKGLMDDLQKEIGRDPKWKRFEKIVAGIHMLIAKGAEVKFNDHIIGKKTENRRQVDVSIRFKHTYYNYLAIVECKDYAGRVPIKEVEANKTAGVDGIELFTLTEVKSDWTKTIKADVLTLPFPTDIEFDHPTFEMPKLYEEPQPMEFGTMYFYKDQYTPPIPLSQILADVSKQVVSDKVSVPCNVKVRCNPPLLTQFPGTSFYTPIYAITIRMENSRFAFGQEIDMPPKLVKYIYSDIAKERVHEIPAEDVPPIK